MQPQQVNDGPAISSLIAVDPKELADRLLEPTTMQAIYEDTEAIISKNRTAGGTQRSGRERDRDNGSPLERPRHRGARLCL